MEGRGKGEGVTEGEWRGEGGGKKGRGIGEVWGSRGFEGGATKQMCGHTNY